MTTVLEPVYTGSFFYQCITHGFVRAYRIIAEVIVHYRGCAGQAELTEQVARITDQVSRGAGRRLINLPYLPVIPADIKVASVGIVSLHHRTYNNFQFCHWREPSPRQPL